MQKKFDKVPVKCNNPKTVGTKKKLFKFQHCFFSTSTFYTGW